MNKEVAKAQVQALVDRYRQLNSAERKKFKEAATRQEFILPLFEALGWDIRNTREVVPEENVSKGYVDFAFRLHGIPQLFLETKRIGENMNRPDAAKQAINYAWLKGVTWAVLSDFEQTKIFNAEWQVENPIFAVFKDLKWDEYVTRFDELWLLSKEAIEAGEMNKLAESVGRKVKKTPVDRKLFEDLTGWRQELFRHIRPYNTTWSIEQVDEAVQRILNRLIFIRTVEDRQIEEKRLQPLVRELQDRRKINALPSELSKLFRELDAIYNARLFAAHFSEDAQSEPAPFMTIIKQLYEMEGAYGFYDFSAINADVLGTIYEQYLGYVAQDPEAKQSVSKQGKRKKQGIFYTPRFVVKYIVQQTLGKMLEQGGLELALKIKVLDPACGSGSFLIEAFDVLDHFIAHAQGQTIGADPHADAERRKQILADNIYGVDLDPQAIEVTKLNLWLRAASSREKLPHLDNIRHGNSLIPSRSVAGDAAFEWQEEFSEIMAQGGFDVIIGNPPYGAKPSRKELNYLHTKYNGESKSYDTFELFMLRASELLNSRGYIGMIIPASWLTGDKYIISRKRLATLTYPAVAYAMPFDIFPDAYVDTAIVSFTKTPIEECLIHYFPKKEPLFSIPRDIGLKVPVEKLRQDEQYRFSVMFADDYAGILAKIESQVATFGEHFDIQRGVQPYSSKLHNPKQIKQRFLHADTPLTDKHLPELQGNELSRYWINPVRSSYLEYSERIASSRDKRMFEGARLVLRRLLTRQFRLQASYTQETLITTDNVLNMVPKDGTFDLHYVLGVLNSRLVSWYYTRISMVAQKDDFPQVHISALKTIPFPKPALTQQKKLAEKVKTLLQAKQEHHGAEAQKLDKRHDLAKKITKLDTEIDELVYQLYGLTADEIRLVEDSVKA